MRLTSSGDLPPTRASPSARRSRLERFSMTSIYRAMRSSSRRSSASGDFGP